VVVSRVRLNGGHDGALPDELAAGSAELNLVVVLAGGVDAQGRPHETVLRRLRAAARLHRQASKRGRALSILCNGGGTTHKPKWVDAQGYAVPEAALMARQLVELGVPYEHIYLEGYSDDTLGNAFFARTMHADARLDWTQLVIITSEFQMARTRAIYDWIFSLAPLPTGKPRYALSYLSVGDAGSLPAPALEARRRKEAASLAAFERGSLVRLSSLQAVHAWLFTAHAAYAPAGVLAKKAMNDSATAASY